MLPRAMQHSPSINHGQLSTYISRVASRCYAVDRIDGCTLLRLWNRLNSVQDVGASLLLHRRYIIALSRHNFHDTDVGHSIEERIGLARPSLIYYRNHCQIIRLDLPLSTSDTSRAEFTEQGRQSTVAPHATPQHTPWPIAGEDWKEGIGSPLLMTVTVPLNDMASTRKRRRPELQSDEIDESRRLKRSKTKMTFEIGTLERQEGEHFQQIARLMSAIEDLMDEQRLLRKRKADADMEKDELAEANRKQRHLIMAYEEQTKEDEKKAAMWTKEGGEQNDRIAA